MIGCYINKPIGWWKCTKSTFRDFKVGEYYECCDKNNTGPRIYPYEGSSWAPYWICGKSKFCYPKQDLDFEYVGERKPLIGVKESVLTISCEGQPDKVIVNGVTYIAGVPNE